MARFIAAHTSGRNGEVLGRGVLKAATLEAMREPHAAEMVVDIWGLGTMLYAPNNDGDFIIGHDGSNEPAINTTARLDPATGDGFVLLVTGNKTLATEMGGEWVFWTSGKVDFLVVTIGVGADPEVGRNRGRRLVSGSVLDRLATEPAARFGARASAGMNPELMVQGPVRAEDAA